MSDAEPKRQINAVAASTHWFVTVIPPPGRHLLERYRNL